MEKRNRVELILPVKLNLHFLNLLSSFYIPQASLLFFDQLLPENK